MTPEFDVLRVMDINEEDYIKDKDDTNFNKISNSSDQLIRVERKPSYNKFTRQHLFGNIHLKLNESDFPLIDRKDSLSSLKQVKDLSLHLPIQIDVDLPLQPKLILKKRIVNKTKCMCWSKYHTFETIVHFLHLMKKKFPRLVDLNVIGHSAEKRPIIVLRITEDPIGTDKIFIEGGIHAREWISPASVTFLINRMLKNWPILPAHMKTKTWFFLPILNPDGYVYTWKHDRMWRKNRSKQPCSDCYGVDLNRNFSIGWRYSMHSNPRHINYKGNEPFSERETSALKNFLTTQKRNLKAYIAFHSYSQQIRYLIDRDDTDQERRRVYQVATLAAINMSRESGTEYTVKGLLPKRYLVGTSRDWAKITFKLKYSFAVELRDQGEFGFLLPEDEILPTSLEAWHFIKTISEAVTSDSTEKMNRIRLSMENR